jgi:hypothetical protein
MLDADKQFRRSPHPGLQPRQVHHPQPPSASSRYDGLSGSETLLECHPFEASEHRHEPAACDVRSFDV